jgi:chromosome segregation ATPase
LLPWLQVAEVRSARDELLAEVAALEQQSQALQAEIDARDAKCAALEKVQAENASQMEVMLGRLRELEGEQQQLEARQLMMQEENLELSTEVYLAA